MLVEAEAAAGSLPQTLSTLFTYLSQACSLDPELANLAELAGRQGSHRAPSVSTTPLLRS